MATPTASTSLVYTVYSKPSPTSHPGRDGLRVRERRPRLAASPWNYYPASPTGRIALVGAYTGFVRTEVIHDTAWIQVFTP